jgi:RHS repeat-associated protein
LFVISTSGQTNYSPLYTSANFVKTINLSRPVGTVAASPGTTPSGGVTYAIPIYSPPGTNGIQSSISVVYNSQGSSGVVGFGWSISGLSVISRTGKNLYHNNVVSPVEYSWNDAFFLDGVRLNPIQGNNGDDGTIYATEAESFSKTISWRGNGSLANPDWFEVTSKDGTIMQFGSTTDSRIFGENGYSVMMWRLNRIVDINGNYIDFKYTFIGRDSRIEEINYTGNINTGLLPYNKIKFNYGGRYDQNTGYDGGASLSTGYLLNNITVSQISDDEELIEVIKKYQFNYGFDNVYSLLKEVVEYGAGISSPPVLNSTIFLYGDSPANLSSEAANNLSGSLSFYSGDFDADGKSDLLAVQSHFDPNVNPPRGMRFDDSYKIINGTNGNSIHYTKPLPQGTSMNLDDKKFYNFLTADYNKDGRDDVLETNISWNSTLQKRIFNNIIINYTTYGSYTPSSPYPFPTTSNGEYKYIRENGNYFIPGDFDGDGNQDYILILGRQYTWEGWPAYEYKAFLTCPAKGTVNQEMPSFGSIIPNPYLPGSAAESVAAADLITPIDIDGDGKQEIVVTPSFGTQSYIITLQGLNATGYITTTDIIMGCKVFPGDFNGDRKADILVRSTANTWKILFSNGLSLIPVSFTFNQTPVLTGEFNIDRIVVSDFNGDGKSDIMHCISNGNYAPATFSAYYSKGYGVFLNELTTGPYPLSSSNNATNPFAIGDFNGDSRTDFLNMVNIYGDGGVIYFKPNGQERLLQKVTDGHNTTTSFGYKLLTDKTGSSPYVYDRTISLDDPANQVPFNYVQLPMFVVSSMTVPDGLGESNTTSFYYENAVVHRHAKGFLGFKKVTAINTGLQSKSVTENEINTQFATPYSVKQSSYLRETYPLPDELLSETFITNSFVNLSTGSNDIRYFQKIDKTLGVDHLNGTASESINTYDNFGNVTVNTSKAGVQSGTTVNPTETTTTTTIFGIHNTPVPAKPDNIVVSNTRTGMSAISATTVFTYTANGLPATQTAFYGLPKAVTTSYTYNSFGNVTQTLTSSTGMSNRTAQAVYDARGRFPVTKKAVGSLLTQTESIMYDGKWGKPLSHTSSDCLTTSFIYDAFGSLIATNMPEGYSVSQSLGWDIQGQQVYYSFTDFPGGKPDSKTWYDKLGRPFKGQVMGFNNQWITQLTTYNNKGNVFTKTNSYYPGETLLVTTNGYDNYNRPISVSNILSSVNTSYTNLGNGLVKVTTQNSSGQSQSKTADASGKVINAIDNGGQLDFTYDSRGNQLETKHGGTTIVSSTYDPYGRQINLIDKNAGTINYDYDAYGQLLQQTDANGNTYTMVYDDFGRITSRQGPEGTTTYEYYKKTKFGITCSNNNLSKVSIVSGFSSIEKEYTFNSLIRMESEKVTINAFIGGQSFTTQYSYDIYGNNTNTTYPSGVVVNNIYDANGGLSSITGGDSWNPVTLFTANAVNGFGQYTNYTLGNGKTSQNTYYYGMPTRLYTQGIQDLNLSFDYTKGNLNSRYDAIKGLTETFQYDNLNRLTTSTVNGVQQLNINYDGNSSFSTGNITSKTDAGNYVYSNQKIHAVNYITNPAGSTAPPITISQALQQLTYTPFLKTATVTEANVQTNFMYGPDYQRLKSEFYVSGSLNTTKYYLGGFERVISGSYTRDIHYITVGNSIAIIETPLYSSSNIHFVYTDYLGSLLTRTDINGTVDAEQNFDAWGRDRNPNTWQYGGTGISFQFFDRGYTGHEHMPYHALINMNGRMYDPIQGRMLSPDNYVPNPLHTQGYNRYSYANNNPLSFTDPDGNFPWLIVGIAAVVSGMANGIAYDMNGKNFLDGFWRGAIVGGASAATGGFLAQILGPGLGATILSGTGSGIVNGGLGASLNGGDIMEGIMQGGITGGIGAGVGAYFGGGTGAFIGGGVSGGLSAALNDGNVLSGFLTGGFSSLAMYHAINYHNYTMSSLKSDLTYNQFTRIGGDYQRSIIRRKEFSGYAFDDGSMVRANARNRHSLRTMSPSFAFSLKRNVVLNYHTHWAKANLKFYINRLDDIVHSPMLGHLSNPTTDGPSWNDQMNAGANNHMNWILIDRISFYSYTGDQVFKQPNYNFTRNNYFSLFRNR